MRVEGKARRRDGRLAAPFVLVLGCSDTPTVADPGSSSTSGGGASSTAGLDPTTTGAPSSDATSIDATTSVSTSPSATSEDASTSEAVAAGESSSGIATGSDAVTGAESTTEVELGPPFVEVAAEVGIDHVADVMQAPPNCLIDAIDPPVVGLFCSPERYAGGAAVGDVDDDGDLDVFVTRPYTADLLYLNDGNGGFADAAALVGLDETLPTSGAALGDVDNDGDQDLYVTTLGELRHYLFVNEGGIFVEDGVARGAAVVTEHPHAGSTPAFGDYDLDGDLDLYVGEWRTHAIGTHPSHARLLRNLGPASPGEFEDVTDAAGVDVDDVYVEVATDIFGTFVLSAGWADIDADGFPELLLASDFNTSRLFWNGGDGTFLDGTANAGVGTDENGMGAAVGDYDGDGDLDWFVSSIMGGIKTGNRMYRYEGDRTFADATDEAGVREGQWGWGAAFFDHDLDGDLDLVETDGWYAKGHLDDPMLAWTNDGTGVFTASQVELGLDDTGQGRALVTFDADGDGDLEVLVVNNGGEVKLYRNDRPDDGSHWLRVRAPGTMSNRDGLGAIVTVDGNAGTQLHEIGGTSHYLGHGPREAHFGLGTDALVDVHVRWPASGAQVDLIDVDADQVLVVEEP